MMQTPRHSAQLPRLLSQLPWRQPVPESRAPRAQRPTCRVAGAVAFGVDMSPGCLQGSAPPIGGGFQLPASSYALPRISTAAPQPALLSKALFEELSGTRQHGAEVGSAFCDPLFTLISDGAVRGAVGTCSTAGRWGRKA
jgi:hypothetical protein